MFEPEIKVHTKGMSIIVTVDDTQHDINLKPILDKYFESKRDELQGAMGAPGEPADASRLANLEEDLKELKNRVAHIPDSMRNKEVIDMRVQHYVFPLRTELEKAGVLEKK